MVLGVLLHLVLPVVAVGALGLLLAGKRGRELLRILVLGQPTRPPLSPRLRRVRLYSVIAVLFAALCAVRAAEAAAASASEGWVVWTMASLAAVLGLGGGIGLAVTAKRRAVDERAAVGRGRGV